MCGSCGCYLFLSGRSRNRRFFTIIAPLWLGMIIISSFVVEALGATVATGPHQSEPTFAAGLFMIFALFVASIAVSGRLEEVLAIDPPKDDLT